MASGEGSEQFALTLKGNGIEIKRTISQRQFAAITSVLMGGEAPTNNTSAGMQIEPAVQISLREYLDQVKASRKPDQIVAIAHYISLYEGQPNFSRDDIKTRFASARERLPANFPRDFNTAIKAGLIAETHQKAGHFYVTKTGIQSVDRHFGAETKKN